MKKMTKKKKLFRKVTALAAVIALGASLAGCGSSGEETTQRYSWPLATASPEDTVTQIFAEKFAEEISELSDGRMKVQVYANSTLGGDRDLLETCADGDIPFVVQNTAPQVSFMGDLAVFDLPCVFDSLDECREKIDNPEFYDLISDVYTEGGYHLLGMADQGFRVMSTNKPVYSFSDFKGGVQQSGMDLTRCKGKTVEKRTALIPAASSGETSRYGVLLVWRKKAVGAYLLERPSGVVVGLKDLQTAMAEAQQTSGEDYSGDWGERHDEELDAQQTSGEDYSGDWGERHDEELTGDAAQQTSGEAGEQAQAVDYASLPLDAEGYPVE